MKTTKLTRARINFRRLIRRKEMLFTAIGIIITTLVLILSCIFLAIKVMAVEAEELPTTFTTVISDNNSSERQMPTTTTATVVTTKTTTTTTVATTTVTTTTTTVSTTTTTTTTTSTTTTTEISESTVQLTAAELEEESSSDSHSSEESNIAESSEKSTAEALTKRKGIVNGPSGKESWYNKPMDGVINIMEDKGFFEEYWIREDGVKMYGNYIMCAANLEIRPRGTILETSLGLAMVCDTGTFIYDDPYQIDIAVNW